MIVGKWAEVQRIAHNHLASALYYKLSVLEKMVAAIPAQT